MSTTGNDLLIGKIKIKFKCHLLVNTSFYMWLIQLKQCIDWYSNYSSTLENNIWYDYMLKLYTWDDGEYIEFKFLGCSLHYTKSLSQDENCGKYFVTTYLENTLSTK